MAYEWIVDALDQTWTAIDRLLRDQPESAFDQPTPCPGWNVRDIVSHLLGFELMLRGTPTPAYEGEWPSHVHNVIGQLNEAFVDAHRSEKGHDVLKQFRDATVASLENLRNLSDEEWEKIGWSPEGERPYHRFQETRVLDSWIHLQDIRDGLLQPEDDHGPGEEVVLNRFEAAMPYVWAKRVGARDETTLRLNLSGRNARTILIQMHEGRAIALTSLDEEPTLEITTPTALFWRRCAGRISADAFLAASATDVRGSKELAQSLSEYMSILI
jgi:uncharacterized protein (TIGR03083 family)